MIKFFIRQAGLVGLLAGVMVATTHAATVVLTSVADTYLFSANATVNFDGDASGMLVGTNAAGGVGRGLLWFDLSTIPGGASIESVSLSLYVGNLATAGAGKTVALHRMLNGWDEATATWNEASGGRNWSAPGGAAGTDYVASSSAISPGMVGASFLTVNSTVSLVSDVQGWVDNPLANRGWMLINQAEATLRSSGRIADGEAIIQAQRPALSVTYSVVPEPASFGLIGLSVVGAVFCAAGSRRAFKSAPKR